jgi:cytochrome c553
MLETPMTQIDKESKVLPMKTIVTVVASLFAFLVVGFLILPAFFDSSPFDMLFHRSPAPWAIDEQTQAKLQLNENQTKGRYHFVQYCSGCHGPDGRGNGPTSQTLARRPPNFLNPSVAGYTNGLTKQGVLKTINEGIQGTQMPKYSHLPEDVKEQISEYVEHLHNNPALY